MGLAQVSKMRRREYSGIPGLVGGVPVSSAVAGVRISKEASREFLFPGLKFRRGIVYSPAAF
jgi:hypothetical protein